MTHEHCLNLQRIYVFFFFYLLACIFCFSKNHPWLIAGDQMTPEHCLSLLKTGGFKNCAVAAALAPAEQARTPWLSCAVAAGVSDGSVTVPNPSVAEVLRKVLAQKQVAGAGVPFLFSEPLMTSYYSRTSISGKVFCAF
jgi:hypothetical protein